MNNINLDDLISKLVGLKNNRSIKITDAKKLFFDYYKLKNSNEQTIKYYKSNFYKIDKFFDKYNVTETSDITDSLFNKIIKDSLEEKLSANYINKLIGTCKRMISILVEQNIIDEQQFKTQKLFVPENRIKTISIDDQKTIFKYLDDFNEREQLVVHLLYETGVRRTELINIKISNINVNDCSIFLEKTKNRIPRTVFFDEKTKNLLYLYLNMFKPKTFLFEKENQPSVHIEPITINRILKKIKKCLNLTSLSAHQFRHTFGTTVYENSLDIELTRELLGHTDYSMTKRYVHQCSSRLKVKYDKFKPDLK